MSTLGPVIEGYLDYCLTIKKLTPATVKDIRCTFNRMSIYCKYNNIVKDFWGLSLPEFTRWINDCRNKNQTAKHINKSLSHVRGLIDYAWRLEKLDRNVLDGFYLKDADQRSEVEILTVEEAIQLVKAFTLKSHIERRNRLIILLLYGCGLRTGELCRLNIQDIDQERQEVKVTGKGRERVIPLMDGIYTELLAYLNDRRSSKGILFKTLIKKTGMSIKDVGDVVAEGAKRSAIEKQITPKTLRHTFASHLADQGVDIGVIAKLMGHRSPKETSTYLHAPKQILNQTVFENIEIAKEVE